MKQTTFFTSVIVAMSAAFALVGCGASGNYTGREYMPDMAHSIAYETNLNTYYWFNHFGSDTAYHASMQPRHITNGTVPRGFTSFMWSGDMDALNRLKENGWKMNGHVPYYYANSDSGRAQAIAAITTNPFPSTKKAVAKGKELYDVNCGICHGETGNGNGYLWRDGEGPYPNKPANFMDEEIKKSSEGRYYHAIMRGKGMMGAYADKLSFEERWDVIHYIRSLQDPAYVVADDVATAKKAADFDLSSAEKMLKGNMVNTTLTLNDLKFKTGSAEIDLAASKDLDDLVKLMNEDKNMVIALNGHTDNAGDPKKNKDLSQARAQAVAAYMVSKGIASSRMTSSGLGDTMPIADNKTDAGKAQNRRTDFMIVKQ